MKNRLNIFVTLLSVATLFAAGCSSNGGSHRKVADVGLNSESDSLAYIVGMNIASQLQKMDSLINYDVVCRAIMEYSEDKAVMSDDEARTQYIRYLLYVEPERRRSIEEKFLVDLAAGDRSFTRTSSGLTYRVEVIGDEKMQSKSQNDWVTIRYNISRGGGEQIYPERDVETETDVETDTDVKVAASTKIEESAAMNDLPKGVQEAIKMIGRGGRIVAWIPSKLGYGEGGDESRGVEPIETIYYDIELVDLERNGASKHEKKEF